MGSDCCGQQASAPAPIVAPIAAQTEETTICQSSCCGGNDPDETLDTTATGQGERTYEEAVDCCSSGNCTDDKTEHDANAPDCCRGKVGPCCDTSCLERLAMRECAMSPSAETNSE